MEEFKEDDDISYDYMERTERITSVRSNGSAKKEKLYTFLSPDLSEDQISNLNYCLDNLDQYEEFIHDVDQNEDESISFPDELIEQIHETLTLLKELLTDLNDKIYSILEEKRYITLIKILDNHIFSEHCIQLLQEMFWSNEPSKVEIEIISKAVLTTPLLRILMNFLKENVFIQNTLTYITNLLTISSVFREQFLQTQDFFDIIIGLENDKDLIKRKLNILVTLLNGKLMEKEQEEIILNTAIDLSLSLSPIKFHVLLDPLQSLTSIKESKSRQIILENHLIDFITQIVNCEKESRRMKAIAILSNICLYEQKEETLLEIKRFNPFNSIIYIIKKNKTSPLLPEAINFVSNWLDICKTIENIDYAFPIIEELKQADFLSFLDYSSYSFKRSCIKIIEKIIFFGNFDQNAEIIAPNVVEKLCEIAKESDEEVCEQVISIFTLFIQSFSDTSTENHSLIQEISETIRSNFDLDAIRDIVEDNEEVQAKLDIFVEKIESLIDD